MASPALGEDRLCLTNPLAAVSDGTTNPAMPILATWIREKDERLFAQFFARYPAIQVRNARCEPADVPDAAGLLLSGGPDIGAAFHNVPIADLSLIEDPEPERDAWEFVALRTAYERALPLFCICKGLQVLNLALGGTLHLDIRGHDLPELKSRNAQPLRFASDVRHRIGLVNSSHHQALDHVADPLEIEAWSASDGVIEQVRIRDYPFGLGVQYHPERDLSYGPLFDDFLSRLK